MWSHWTISKQGMFIYSKTTCLYGIVLTTLYSSHAEYPNLLSWIVHPTSASKDDGLSTLIQSTSSTVVEKWVVAISDAHLQLPAPDITSTIDTS